MCIRSIFKNHYKSNRRNVERRHPVKHFSDDSRSPFLQVPRHDIVLDWPVDPMHSIYARVVRRMLEFMTSRAPSRVRLSLQSKQIIGDALTSIEVPGEFQRTTRHFHEWTYWTCTEKRMFLLYTGLFVMKDVPLGRLGIPFRRCSPTESTTVFRTRHFLSRKTFL